MLAGSVLNPKGRGKLTAEALETKSILQCASPKAARKLVELIDSPDEKIALLACKEIVERALGKASASEEDAAQAAASAVDGLSTAELIRLAMSAVKVALDKNDGREPH